MPFGLHAAPATFQRLLDHVVTAEMAPHVFAYLDDIVIVSDTYERHTEILTNVFDRLHEAKLRPNWEKCHFACKRLRYLGHIIDENGLQTDPEKVSAVTELKAPQDAKELRRFLGFVSSYRRFIKDAAMIASPLNKLLTKKNKWEWGKAQQTAFDQLKTSLTQAPVLACPDWSQPFTLQTDASREGLGAVLTQGEGDNERVIAYASRSLNKAERNYSATELECLAVKWGV